VLSPGFTSPRSTLTARAEELAGHGYVVAGIDHVCFVLDELTGAHPAWPAAGLIDPSRSNPTTRREAEATFPPGRWPGNA
jgi:hypothetical protein